MPMSDAAAVISTLSPTAAKMVAVEILLADPESLGDDVLEGCLYILRERLRAQVVRHWTEKPATKN
jgi:hypothetical protein